MSNNWKGLKLLGKIPNLVVLLRVCRSADWLSNPGISVHQLGGKACGSQLSTATRVTEHRESLNGKILLEDYCYKLC